MGGTGAEGSRAANRAWFLMTRRPGCTSSCPWPIQRSSTQSCGAESVMKCQLDPTSAVAGRPPWTRWCETSPSRLNSEGPVLRHRACVAHHLLSLARIAPGPQTATRRRKTPVRTSSSARPLSADSENVVVLVAIATHRRPRDRAVALRAARAALDCWPRQACLVTAPRTPSHFHAVPSTWW